MLCPELFKFPTPSYNIEGVKGSCWSQMMKSSNIKAKIESLPFVRMVSAIIPANEPQFVHAIANDLDSGTCSLYLARQFSLAEMVRKEFLEAFVKRGKFYGISSKTSLETDDCAAILPDATLILSLNRDTYQGLNICSSLFSRRRNKYVVKIDLKSQAVKQVAENQSVAWDMVLRWIPPELPSNLGVKSSMAVSIRSLEHYLRDSRRIAVEKILAADCNIKRLDGVSVPLLEKGSGKNEGTDGFYTADELMEYIGLLVLDCDLKPNNYLREPLPDGCMTRVDSTWQLNRQGMYTADEMERIIGRLVAFVEKRSSDSCEAVPWVALHVQGFSNLPVKEEGSRACGVCYDHDNGYTIVVNGHGVLWRKSFRCN